jgi:hypothetical protein
MEIKIRKFIVRIRIEPSSKQLEAFSTELFKEKR